MRLRLLTFLVGWALAAQTPPAITVGPSNPTGQHGATWTLQTQDPPQQPTDGTTRVLPTQFNVYRSQTKGGPYTLVGSVPVVSAPVNGVDTSTYLDGCGFPPAAGCSSPFADGSTWYYVFTGFGTGLTNPATVNTRTNTPGESEDSPETAVTFPTPTKAAAPPTVKGATVH